MAKKKKKAKPRRQRTAVVLPTNGAADVDDIQDRKQKRLAVLYEGLNTKEEILKRWEDEIIAPIHDEEGLITDEHARLLASWWSMYKDSILADDHETAETLVLKVRTDAFIDTLKDLFTPVRYSRSVSKKVYELIDGLGAARGSESPSDQVK